jgi:hypothetical protein
MHSDTLPADQTTLGFTVIALSLALEEALDALAEKSGNVPGAWLDELEELALLRAKGAVMERVSIEKDAAAMAAALDIVKLLFTKSRSQMSPG